MAAVAMVAAGYYGTSPSQGRVLPRSDHAAGWRQRFRPTKGVPSAAPRGQSMVEFALVLPLLLILFMGIADFGRVFAAGITEEAAVRDGAEAAALQWQQLCQKYSPPCVTGLTQPDYDSLHALARNVACREAERMPGRVLDGTGNCVMPIIAVCIHDDHDPGGGDLTCGSEAPAPGGPCNEMDAPWTSVRAGPSGGRPYVEVRVCYRFDPLFSFALGGLGSVWLQKANVFAVTNY